MRGSERSRRRVLLRQRALPAALLAACAFVILNEHHPRLWWRQRDLRGEAAISGDRHLPGWDSGAGRREALDISQLERQRDGSDGSGNGGGDGGGGSTGGIDGGPTGGDSGTEATDGGTGGGFGGSVQMAWAAGQQAVRPVAEAASSGGGTGDDAQTVAVATHGSAAADTTAAPEQEEVPQRRQEAPRQRELLAVLVPYRDRGEQLSVFMRHMRAHLSAQGIPFRVIVAEQLGSGPFNRGALLNVAFLEAEKQEAAYVVVHDVDMLPLEGVDYNFPRSGPGVLHLASEPQQFGWRAPHDRYCSGALLVTTQLFRAANGYSNGYWGWGGEDDDFCLRLSRQLAEARAGGSKPVKSAGAALPRAPHGSGLFAATGDHTVAPDRKEFQQLNLARLTMWRLAGGSGCCMEGLSDVEAAGWGAYAETERQAADLVHIFQELPPEVAPGLVLLPSRASPSPPAERDAAEFAAAEAALRKAQLGQHAKLEALERAQWALAPAMLLYDKAVLHQPKAVGLGSGEETLHAAEGAELDDVADDAAAADGSTAVGNVQLGSMYVKQHTDGTAPQPSSSLVEGSNSGGGGGGLASVGAPGRGQGSGSGAAVDSNAFVDGGGWLSSALPVSLRHAGSDADSTSSVSHSGGIGDDSSTSRAGIEEEGLDEEDNDDLDAGMVLGYGDALQAAAATTRGSVVQHLVDDPDWAIVRQQGSISSGKIGGAGNGGAVAAKQTSSDGGAGASLESDSGNSNLSVGRWVDANDIEALSGSGSDGDGRQQEAAGELPGSAAAAGVQKMGAAAQRFWEKRRKRRNVGRDENGGISGYLQNLIVE